MIFLDFSATLTIALIRPLQLTALMRKTCQIVLTGFLRNNSQLVSLLLYYISFYFLNLPIVILLFHSLIQFHTLLFALYPSRSNQPYG